MENRGYILVCLVLLSLNLISSSLEVNYNDDTLPKVILEYPVTATSSNGSSSNFSGVHNDLTGLQGGTAGEYYHIQQSWFNELTTNIFNFLTAETDPIFDLWNEPPTPEDNVAGINKTIKAQDGGAGVPGGSPGNLFLDTAVNTGLGGQYGNIYLAKNGGAVGIGTTGVLTKTLFVEGSFQANSIALDDNTGTVTIQTAGGTDTIIFANQPTGKVQIRGGQNASPVGLTIDNNGLLGIGTATPTQMLDVRGNGNFSGTIYINNVTDISEFTNSLWATNGTSIYNSTVSQVGIGTATPSRMLELRGTQPFLRLRDTRNLGDPNWDNVEILGIEFWSTDPSTNGNKEQGAIIMVASTTSGAAPNGDMVFYTSFNNGTRVENMRIKNGGFIGIMDTTPDALLDVAGSGIFDGNLTIGQRLTGLNGLILTGVANVSEDINVVRDVYIGDDLTNVGEHQGSKMILPTNRETSSGFLGINNYVFMNAGDVGMTGTKGYVMTRAGSFTGFSLISDLTAAFGPFLTVDVLKNNAVIYTYTTGSAVSTGTDQAFYGIQARGTDTFAAGDVISMRIGCVGAGAATLQFVKSIGTLEFYYDS